MSVAISIENVIKRFGKDTIINGLSLDIRPGEFFTLLGPSGCGKTTLLRMIIGFNSIEGGEIKIDGKVINNIPTNKRNMGMVFQNYAIFPHMSVRDNVAFGLKNRKVPQDQIESQVDEILKVVKIDHLKSECPPSCPAASSSVWPWPEPLSSTRRCCSWTNPCPTWTQS